ncbi:MAG: OmpA family protein [Hyphomicrobiaceae bacterium]|nr:OmpA family protein [Hyphomicrobiaceae bacterium]
MSATTAGAGPAKSASGPSDLLSDGFDALDAGRSDLARKIFETILASYPQSTEAAAASEALISLDEEEGAADNNADPAPASNRAPASNAANVKRATTRDSFSANTATGNVIEPGAESGLLVSAEQVRRTRNRFLTDVGDRVFFSQNSALLGGRARSVVEAQAQWLKRMPSLEITVIGRSADGGSTRDEADLSLARARAVEAKLIESGIEPSRIRVEARGAADPVATCSSALCQAQNRHVESLINYAGMGTSQLSAPSPEAMAIELPASAPTRPLAR